jgi:hypothetical protein
MLLVILVWQMSIVYILLDWLLGCNLLLGDITLLFFDVTRLTRYLRIHRLVKQAINPIINKLDFPLWTVTSIIQILRNKIFFCPIIIRLMFALNLCEDWKIDFFFLYSCLKSLNIRLRLELILFNSHFLLRYRLTLQLLLRLDCSCLYLSNLTISWFCKITRWWCGATY